MKKMNKVPSYMDVILYTYGYVVVKTDFSLIAGWETMVFDCDSNGRVINWSGRDRANYFGADAEEAHIGHMKMVEKWRQR